MKGYSVDWNGERFFDIATKVNITAMKKAAAFVDADVTKNFTLQGTGAESKRTKGGKVHRASAPGEAPAVDYDALRASINHKVEKEGLTVHGYVGSDLEEIKKRLSKRKGAVGTDLEYGLYLELGTSKMQARPYLRPALRRCAKTIERIFKNANG